MCPTVHRVHRLPVAARPRVQGFKCLVRSSQRHSNSLERFWGERPLHRSLQSLNEPRTRSIFRLQFFMTYVRATGVGASVYPEMRGAPTLTDTRTGALTSEEAYFIVLRPPNHQNKKYRCASGSTLAGSHVIAEPSTRTS